MKKKDSAEQKSVNDIRQVNAKLSQPLQKNLALIEELKKEMQTYEKVS